MEHVERLLVLRGVLASGRLRGAGGCSSARTLLSGRYLGVACCRPCAAWSVFNKKKKKKKKTGVRAVGVATLGGFCLLAQL
jgi:hypothetical protein